MSTSIRTNRIQIAGLPGRFARIALARDQLAAVTDDCVLCLCTDLRRSVPSVRSLARLEGMPSALSLSPSGGHVLIRDPEGRCAVVREVAREAAPLEFGGAEVLPGRVVASLTTNDEGDVLLISQRDRELEAYLLDGARRLFQASFHRPLAFYVDSLCATFSDHDTFFVIGHLGGEGNDSVVRFSIRALASQVEAATRVFASSQRIQDYASRLAVGPCEPDQVVIFRDSGDDEDPADTEEEPKDAREELWGHNGFYVRRLEDGALIEKIPIDLPLLRSGAPLVGTSSVIAAVCPDRVEIIPRRAGAPRATIRGRAFSLDTEAARLAVVTLDGHLDIIDLPQ